jgi:hypothetical protein
MLLLIGLVSLSKMKGKEKEQPSLGGPMTKIFLSALALLIASQANAQTIRLGNPAYGGTGCPAGSASVTVSPDQSAISVLFDQFLTEAGNTTRRRIDRKSCNLSVPVQVPGGYSVAVFAVDYRGYNAVPRGGYNKLEAEYFWAGARGPRIVRQFNGPLNDSYSLTDDLMASTVVWTPCGQSVNLRVNASMMSMANSRMEQTLGTVDSIDLTSGLVYHIRFQRCR